MLILLAHKPNIELSNCVIDNSPAAPSASSRDGKADRSNVNTFCHVFIKLTAAKLPAQPARLLFAASLCSYMVGSLVL